MSLNAGHPPGVVVVSHDGSQTVVSGLYPYIKGRGDGDQKWADVCKELNAALKPENKGSVYFGNVSDFPRLMFNGDIRQDIAVLLFEMLDVPSSVILVEMNAVEKAAKYVKQQIEAGNALRVGAFD